MDSSSPPTIARHGESAPTIMFDNVWIGLEEGPILRGLTFSTSPGETLVLLGETGTGKTLALKIAAGLLCPDRGTVKALGQEITNKTEQELLEFRRQVLHYCRETLLPPLPGFGSRSSSAQWNER